MLALVLLVPIGCTKAGDPSGADLAAARNLFAEVKIAARNNCPAVRTANRSNGAEATAVTNAAELTRLMERYDALMRNLFGTNPQAYLRLDTVGLPMHAAGFDYCGGAAK